MRARGVRQLSSITFPFRWRFDFREAESLLRAVAGRDEIPHSCLTEVQSRVSEANMPVL